MQYLVDMNTFFPPTQPGNTLNSSPLCHTTFPNFSSYCAPLTIHFYFKFQVALFTSIVIRIMSGILNIIEQKNCEWNME